MKIVFTTTSTFSFDTLIALTNVEGVGYDPNFGCTAEVATCLKGQVKLYQKGALVQEAPAEGFRWKEVVVDDLKGMKATWVTHAGHTYGLLGDQPDGRVAWVYNGPDRGFLHQVLLPALEDPRVLWVEGSYGRYEGPDALEAYRRRKTAWVKMFDPLRRAKELDGRPSSFDVGRVAAAAYVAAVTEDQETHPPYWQEILSCLERLG